jgi:hypothetical protein
MSGRRGSSVFVECDDLDAVEDAVLSVLADEQYAYGALERIPIGGLTPATRGWCLLVPEPSFDFSDRQQDRRPWLAKISARLGRSAFQLDAGDYSLGLLETSPSGDYLISGWLGRWDSGDEPDIDEEEDAQAIHGSDGMAAPLRQALRRRDSDAEDSNRLAMKLVRSLVGPDFDPREPEAWEQADSRSIVYVRRPRHEDVATTASPALPTNAAKAASAAAKVARSRPAKAKPAKARPQKR